MARLAALTAALVVAASTSGCMVPDRLRDVGRAPELSPIADPTAIENYRPVTMPMPAPEPVGPTTANSLWRTGARGFFKDQRARQVGDILTVNVTIKDEARVRNETSRSRNNDESLGIGGLFGLDHVADMAFPESYDATRSVDLQSETSNNGQGQVRRQEDISLDVAAVIVQVLPNGNMVIRGRQEVRVNFEVRELIMGGIVRPEDITPTNTIPHDKIAELRVAYGGRGQITDVQQPRYGTQVLDILLPF